MKKVMKKIALFSFLILGLSAFAIEEIRTNAPQTALDIEPCYMENTRFQAGEQLVYKLFYNWNFVWLSAGEVTFNVNEVDGQYHLSAVGRTYASYEWFYKVRDYYDTYVDKNSLLPQTSIKNVNEGKYKLYNKVEFNQDEHIAVANRGKTADQTHRKEYNVEECMHDVLSVIYYARNIKFDELETGQSFPIKIFMDKKTHALNVKYKGKEAKKKVKGFGKFNTIKFSPEVIAGEVFKEDDQMNVWVSDDQNCIPLLIESPVSVGSVKAVLKSHTGLKYDLDAYLGK